VLRAINSAAIKKQLLHSEIVNVIPLDFDLDDHKGIQNPKKMVGKKLGVRAVIVASPKDLVIQTVLAVEKAGMNVLDIVISPIADANQVLNQAEYEMYGTVINIGFENTNIVVYENHKIRGLITRNVGMDNVVNDIAFIYKISKEDARLILRQYGVLKESLASKEVNIDTKTVEGKDITFTQFELFEIIEARVIEILNLSYNEVQKITENKPMSIVLSGGSLNIEGYEAVINKVFGQIGRSAEYTNVGARDPKYSTAMGLIKTIYKKQVLRGKLKLSLSETAEEELVTFKKKSIQIDEDSVLGKVFGFFFE
jgi:cell division protein FtsA